MAREEESKLNGTTHCHCGIEWGKHCNEIDINIKYHCVACDNEIGVRKNKMFIPNQCYQRYIEKGNYCDKCNNNASKHTKSSSELDFLQLFKHKQK